MQIYLCVAIFLFLVLSIVGIFSATEDEIDDLEREMIPSIGDEYLNNHNNVIRVRNDLPDFKAEEETNSSNDRRRNGRKDDISILSAIHRPLIAKHNSHVSLLYHK